MFNKKKLNKKVLVLLSCGLFCVLLFSSTPSNAQFFGPWSPLPTRPIFNPIYPAPIPSPFLATINGAEALTFIAPASATTIPAAYIWLSLAAPATKLTSLPVPTTIYILPPAPPTPIIPPALTAVLPPIGTATAIAIAPPIVSPILPTPIVLPPIPTVPAPTIINVLPPTPTVPVPTTTVAPAAISAFGGLVPFSPFQQVPQLNFGFNPFFNSFNTFNPFLRLY